MSKIKEIISLIKELRKHDVIRPKKKKRKTKKLKDKKKYETATSSSRKS